MFRPWKLELKLIDKVVEPIATRAREDNETQIFAIFSSQETRMILNNPEAGVSRFDIEFASAVTVTTIIYSL